METIRNEHLSEDELEAYAENRLPRETVRVLSEHLMVCDVCAELLEREQDLRRDIRAAVEQAATMTRRQQSRGWSPLRMLPTPAIAAIAVVSLVLLVVPSLDKTVTSPQTVTLSAYRSGAPTAATATTPLLLALEGADLGDLGSPQVRILDARGRHVWSGVASRDRTNWLARVPATLRSGVYWVQLAHAGEEFPVREFRLQVQ